MRNQADLQALLQAYNPRLLNASRRGSGLNAVWRIDLAGNSAILKTYHLRRSRLQTFLTTLEHALSGRTPYTAVSRQQTERRNLSRWRTLGFDVPAVIEHTFSPHLPIAHLCIEDVPGTLLSDALADPAMGSEDRTAAMRKLFDDCGRRHRLALEHRDPCLVHEHPGLEHIIISGNRQVTLDLEVSYRATGNLRCLVAREIGGICRSLLKRLPADESRRALDLLVATYPDRESLLAVRTKKRNVCAELNAAMQRAGVNPS